MAIGAVTTNQEIVDLTLDLVHGLQRVEAPRERLQLVDYCRRQLDVVESETVSERYDAGDSDVQVENLFDDGKTSKTEAKKRASRGKAVNANPGLADRMREGTLSTDQADVIADAARDSDGAAACDDELIDEIEKTTPEQGKKKTQDWVTKRKSDAELETEQQKQHRLLNCEVIYGNRKGELSKIIIEGPRRSIEPMAKAILGTADDGYQADGGREKSRDEHPRTHGQRMFDAAHQLLTRPDDQTSNVSGEGKPVSKRKRGPAAVLHVNVTPGHLNGTDLSIVRTCDGQPLPRNIVEMLGCDCELVGHVFDDVGRILWEGRRYRNVTNAQWDALIARDGGCQQCDKPWTECVAHHVIPWHAPARGETNIDNLVLLCDTCHTRVHTLKLTMVRYIETRAWETRPATWDELPGEPPVGTRKRKTQHRTRIREKPTYAESRKQKLASIRARHGLTGDDPPLW